MSNFTDKFYCSDLYLMFHITSSIGVKAINELARHCVGLISAVNCKLRSAPLYISRLLYWCFTANAW